MRPEVERARACAAYFRRMGLCPLPSREDKKGPALATFGTHYDGVPVPEWVYEEWDTTNIQLVTGTTSPGRTKICVVDLDGQEAKEKFALLCEHNKIEEKTWTSVTGGGGEHRYYRLPEKTESCPSRLLWGLWDTAGNWDPVKKKFKPDWVKHKEIRLLADRNLVIAPPSKHVEFTDRSYCFSPGLGPRELHLPAYVPDWILDMPAVEVPRNYFVAETPPPLESLRMPQVAFCGRLDRSDLNIDVVAVAGLWGVRGLTPQPNAAGWHRCHAVGREDRNRSGSLSINGVYLDQRDGVKVPFFQLGVLCGRFSTWQECAAWCQENFGTSR